jgi:hypothetical protein
VVEYAGSATHADEAAVTLAAHTNLAVVKAAASLESARALAARAHDAFAVYCRLEHVRQGSVTRVHLAIDGVFLEPRATMMEQEQRTGRSYEMFKEMVVVDPNLDPSF